MSSVANHAPIAFNRLYNFRDIGGFPTQDGRTMKSGVLFRSDDLSRLTRKDLETLQQCKLQIICDLRTQNERKSKPDRIPDREGVRLISVPIHHESQDFSRLDLMRFLIGKSTAINFENVMKEFYQRMAFERTAQVKEVITLISEQENLPALIHCTGGKDRTGYISALIQLLVGVPYHTVLDQYLLSNELIQPRMKKIERMIRWMSLFQVSPERMKPMLEVRREYLDDILRDVLIKYGSIEEYLSEACGIDESCILNLRKLLLQ